MSRFSKFFLSFLLLEQLSFAQKSKIYRLEKLHQPQPSSGEFVDWKNESLLIPIRFDSKSKKPVKVNLSGLKADFKVYQLHEVWRIFLQETVGKQKLTGFLKK